MPLKPMLGTGFKENGAITYELFAELNVALIARNVKCEPSILSSFSIANYRTTGSIFWQHDENSGASALAMLRD